MTILIAGAGQLGSRYLQGLAKSGKNHKIILIDPAEDSIGRALERFQEAGGNTKRVSAYKEIKDSLPPIDLAIISSLASTRFQITKTLLESTSVKSFVLEKLLAQNTQEIDSLQKIITDTDRTWVNTPRRIMHFYSNIREFIKQKNLDNSPLHIEVKGGNWGLACNSIHFIDLAEWLSGSDLETCQVQAKLIWKNSKRPEIKEANGKIYCKLEGGHSLELINDDSIAALEVNIKSQHIDLKINETKGTAVDHSKNFTLHGSLEFQSELTGPLVENILEKQTCLLPSLETSAKQHRIFLKALAEDFFSDQMSVEPAARLPIT